MKSPHGESPCASCPYRKDAPLAHWDASHFFQVLASEEQQFGDMFNCHGHIKKKPEDRGFCIGWLLDQKNRGVPNINLRLKLTTNAVAKEAFKRAHAGGAKLFKSALAMCTANLQRIARQRRRLNPKGGTTK